MNIDRRGFLRILSSAVVALYPGYAVSNVLAANHDVIYLEPDHPDFAQHQQPFNRRIQLQPRYIAVCYSVEGVSKAVVFAKNKQLSIAIKSGGHSFEGFSLNNGGLVIDLSQLNQLNLIPDNKLYAGPGCRLANLYDYLLPKGRIIPVGSCGGVGLGGLTLGGGYGLFSRQWGLSCDNLIGLRLVDGQGKIHDSDDRPELLWACRGGGNGNFGVVTELRYKTHAAPGHLSHHRIKFYQLTAEKAAWLAKHWFAKTVSLPNDAFSAFVLNGRTLTILVTYFQPDSAKSVAAIVNALSIGADKVLPVKTQPLMKAVTNYYGRKEPLYFKNVSAGFYSAYADLESVATDIFNDVANTKGMLFQINTLGGAIADKALLDSAAYPHRLLPYLGELQCYWDNGSQTAAKVDSVNRVQKKLHNAGIDKHYRNYPSLEIKNYAIAYYGRKNYQKLQAIKKRYDPENVFLHPQSIDIK